LRKKSRFCREGGGITFYKKMVFLRKKAAAVGPICKPWGETTVSTKWGGGVLGSIEQGAILMQEEQMTSWAEGLRPGATWTDN